MDSSGGFVNHFKRKLHLLFYVCLQGPHVKIMSQTEVEAMTAQKQQQQQMKVDQSAANNSDDKSTANGATATDSNAENVGVNGDKAAVDDDSKSQQQQPQTSNQQQQQHHQQNQMHHYNGPPPHFGGPQYGMPPPGYNGYQPGPWGMPWQHPPQQQMSEQPAKNLIVKPGVIEPQVIARAAEWSEHRAPDGRPYYYHAGRGESVWEKPQAIRDLEGKRKIEKLFEQK